MSQNNYIWCLFLFFSTIFSFCWFFNFFFVFLFGLFNGWFFYFMSTLEQQEILKQLANMKMPFGKYQGRVLMDLPEPYLVWFAKKGFPSGQLGERLRLLYEIKLNGLEYLLKPLRKDPS